jgi:hypothetical protein
VDYGIAQSMPIESTAGDLKARLDVTSPRGVVVFLPHAGKLCFAVTRTAVRYSLLKNLYFWLLLSGASFGIVRPDLRLHRITDDEMVECFKGRPNVQFVFLNGCDTTGLCRRLQLECGIPVVMGWDDEVVPSQQLMAMVRKSLFV